MALTPLSLTEQQMQPLARSSHSSALVLFWETVRERSMSVVFAEFWRIVRAAFERRISSFHNLWEELTIEDDGDFLAVSGRQDVVEQGSFAST